MRFSHPREPLGGILAAVITTFVVVAFVSGTYRHCLILPLVIGVLVHMARPRRR